MGLTVKTIHGLSAPGMYRDDRTLFLKVSQSSKKDPELVSKSWVQRIMQNGVRHDLGLGSWPVVSIVDARSKAMENRIKVAKGISLKDDTEIPKPKQLEPKHSKPVKSGKTFREIAEEVIRFRSQGWKNPYPQVRAWETSLELYAFPSIGDKTPQEITAGDVKDILAAHWFDKHDTMKNVRDRIGIILQEAVTQGLVPYNVALGVDKTLPKITREEGETGFKAVPHAEVKNVIAKIQDSNARQETKLCLEFCILTATRPSEARLAVWDEIDLDAKVWTIPASRMKAKQIHIVPLSSRACEILIEAKGLKAGHSNLVFPGRDGSPIGAGTISKLCLQNEVGGQLHAISRSCFSSWAAEQGVNSDVYEQALAHTVKGVKGSYQRSKLFKLRVPVMQQWANYLAA